MTSHTRGREVWLMVDGLSLHSKRRLFPAINHQLFTLNQGSGHFFGTQVATGVGV
jgi:hypothetical protein